MFMIMVLDPLIGFGVGASFHSDKLIERSFEALCSTDSYSSTRVFRSSPTFRLSSIRTDSVVRSSKRTVKSNMCIDSRLLALENILD